MDQNEITMIDNITASVNELLKGNIPRPLKTKAQKNDEIKQLGEFINLLIDDMQNLSNALFEISKGNLYCIINSKSSTGHSLKNLQATLRHITWQTEQVSNGDFSQRINFLGEFSNSFNWMVKQLELNRDNLEEIVNKHTRELTFLLNTTVKTTQILDPDEILDTVAELLTECMDCHTFSRVAIFEKPRKTFKIKSWHSLRSVNIYYEDEQLYNLASFDILKSSLKKNEPKVIEINHKSINDNEKEFLFLGLFKSVLILPFLEKGQILGFALINEARNLDRSKFDIDFFKTFSNHLTISIKNALLFRKNKLMFMHTIKSLAAAIDERDKYTHDHSRNVTRFAVHIANKMELPPGEIENIKTAGLLHDIGKIGIRDNILLKPSKLSNSEYDIIKTHPEKAVKILKTIDDFEDILDIILAHHERFDGKGYPKGLKNKKIPIGAKIIALADTFDAITTSRVYRKASDFKYAIEEIKRCSGTQFDPEVVKAFLEVVSEF